MMKLLIISGLSGSGKSIALHALEDLDYYCVDNLPVELLSAFAAQMNSARSQYHDAAVSIDARNLATDFQHFPQIVSNIRQAGLQCEIFFLDADDSTLFKRFSETRRKHPLTRADVSLAEAIRFERKLLEPIATLADWHIDTSRTNIHQLRSLIQARVARQTSLSLSFVSFGYKHGVPADADFVFDTRCLPNPHWEPQMRLLTGLDADVVTFLENHALVTQMFEDIKTFLETWIPRFEAENRNYMTVAIGCTGGQHRSVYLVERLAAYFLHARPNVLRRHRELA